MQQIFEIIRQANSYLVNSDPPDAPTFDVDWAESDGFDTRTFSDMLTAKPPLIQFYRSKFYAIEYKTIKYEEGSKLISIMRDQDGECHTIMSEGEVVWTKER